MSRFRPQQAVICARLLSPAMVKDFMNGLGAHSVIEAAGTRETETQAIGATALTSAECLLMFELFAGTDPE